jgi:hypothetical protein
VSGRQSCSGCLRSGPASSCGLGQRSTSRRTSASLRTAGRRFVQEEHASLSPVRAWSGGSLDSPEGSGPGHDHVPSPGYVENGPQHAAHRDSLGTCPRPVQLPAPETTKCPGRSRTSGASRFSLAFASSGCVHGPPPPVTAVARQRSLPDCPRRRVSATVAFGDRAPGWNLVADGSMVARVVCVRVRRAHPRLPADACGRAPRPQDSPPRRRSRESTRWCRSTLASSARCCSRAARRAPVPAH